MSETLPTFSQFGLLLNLQAGRNVFEVSGAKSVWKQKDRKFDRWEEKINIGSWRAVKKQGWVERIVGMPDYWVLSERGQEAIDAAKVKYPHWSEFAEWLHEERTGSTLETRS